MPVGVVVALISQVGLPLALKLIDLYMKNQNVTVTAAEWEALRLEIQNPFVNLAGPK